MKAVLEGVEMVPNMRNKRHRMHETGVRLMTGRLLCANIVAKWVSIRKLLPNKEQAMTTHLRDTAAQRNFYIGTAVHTGAFGSGEATLL